MEFDLLAFIRRCNEEDSKKRWEATFGRKKVEHEESEDCWCCPTLSYRDPETGIGVWVHNEKEDSN